MVWFFHVQTIKKCGKRFALRLPEVLHKQVVQYAQRIRRASVCSSRIDVMRSAPPQDDIFCHSDEHRWFWKMAALSRPKFGLRFDFHRQISGKEIAAKAFQKQVVEYVQRTVKKALL